MLNYESIKFEGRTEETILTPTLINENTETPVHNSGFLPYITPFPSIREHETFEPRIIPSDIPIGPVREHETFEPRIIPSDIPSEPVREPEIESVPPIITEYGKYACQKTGDVKDRCIKVSGFPLSSENLYPTMRECIQNCNLEEEEVALKKLKEKYKLKNLIEYIRPELTDTVLNLKDIPILNYKTDTYNKKILDVDEIKTLYTLLHLAPHDKYSFNNLFFDRFVKSNNAIIGKDLVILIKDNTSFDSHKIIYSLRGKEKEYIYNFTDDEYIKAFDKEIETFINSSDIILIKSIDLQDQITVTAHRTFIIIKKNTSKQISTKKINFDVFIYDPVSENYENSPISDKLELYIMERFAGKYTYSFLNLSKLYGVQNFEVSKNTTASILSTFGLHVESIENNLNKLSHEYKNILSHEYRKLFIHTTFDEKTIFKTIILIIYFNSLSNKYIMKEDINNLIDQMFETLVYSPATDDVSFKITTLIDIFRKKLHSKMHALETALIKINDEKNDLYNKINEYYYYDYFEGNCQLWCYYTIILISNNPTINPYNIIKASFYQSSDITKMNLLFNDKKEVIERRKNTIEDPDSDIFNYDSIEVGITQINRLKNFKENESSKIFDEQTRLLYIKITNLIIINILYNRSFDKYFLYSVETHSLVKDTFKKLFIPQKVDELLNDFKFPSTEMTAENIIKVVKTGQNIIDVNTLILREKRTTPLVLNEEPSVFPPFNMTGGGLNNDNYYKKYLKYKNKYMKLKKHL